MNSIQHALAPAEAAFQLDVPVVLAVVDDERDGCISRLESVLSTQTGVRRVHLDHDEVGHPFLCLHYDPNLAPLEKLQRLAHEGAAITGRFKHETWPLKDTAQGTLMSLTCISSAKNNRPKIVANGKQLDFNTLQS